MRKPTVIATLLIAAACTDRIPVTPDLGAPNASISDAVHENGTAGFYFLPPLVPSPQTSGTFDASLLPFIAIEVCRVDPDGCTTMAQFTSSSTVTCGPKDASPPASGLVRVSEQDELYTVNWDTGECSALDAAKTYRITVRVAGTELGHADLDVVENGAGLKNVGTQEFVGFVDGRTLPIKFRIEEGAVFVVGSNGGTVASGDGQVVLRIPEGALSSALGITVRPGGAGSEEEGTIPGTLWEFGPDRTEFTVPAELTLAYLAGALPSDLTDPATSLVLVTQEGGEWAESPTTVDPNAHTITGPVFGFSVKAVAVKTIDLDVQPSSIILAPSGSSQVESSARSGGGRILKKRAIEKRALDEQVATIDAFGVVRAVDVGSTSLRFAPRLPRLLPAGIDPCSLPYVLCTFPNRHVPVVVRRPVASVAVSPASASVVVGGTFQLAAELRDAEENLLTDRDMVWSTQDAGVATVSPTGLVTGVAGGSVVIEAASEGRIGLATIIVSMPAIPVWQAVTTGQSHSCGLRTDGSLFCWGAGAQGQLGFVPSETCGTVTCSKTPQPAAGELRFVQVDAGLRHTCGLTADGVAYCWGENIQGQLGVGSTSLIFSSTPLPVAGGLRFTALSAGVFHTCGRRADGSVFCWGNNSQGQIGNGLPRQFADEFPHSPSRVLGGLAFVEISAGGGHTCGLVSSGAAYCWGSNLVGQLGTPTEICTTFGSIPCSAVPILVSTDLLFSHIVAGGVLTGGSQTCGLTAAGQAYCWGSNEFGELGIGTSLQRTMTPMVVVGGLAFSSISAGAGHTCAVSQEDIPACWGNNAFGQTGDGTSGTNRIRPTIVQEGLEVSSISASTANGHVCTVTKDGAIYCWGMNTIAQLGDGTTTNRSVPVRVRDP